MFTHYYRNFKHIEQRYKNTHFPTKQNILCDFNFFIQAIIVLNCQKSCYTTYCHNALVTHLLIIHFRTNSILLLETNPTAKPHLCMA